MGGGGGVYTPGEPAVGADTFAWGPAGPDQHPRASTNEYKVYLGVRHNGGEKVRKSNQGII